MYEKELVNRGLILVFITGFWVRTSLIGENYKNSQSKYFFSGSKRTRLSDHTKGTILAGDDTGNEDDRESDSGGELRANHPLGKGLVSVIFFRCYRK